MRFSQLECYPVHFLPVVVKNSQESSDISRGSEIVAPPILNVSETLILSDFLPIRGLANIKLNVALHLIFKRLSMHEITKVKRHRPTSRLQGRKRGKKIEEQHDQNEYCIRWKTRIP